VPVTLPNPQNRAPLQYWVSIRFSRPIPLPETWPDAGSWPEGD
jgi:hypothetical protein